MIIYELVKVMKSNTSAIADSYTINLYRCKKTAEQQQQKRIARVHKHIKKYFSHVTQHKSGITYHGVSGQRVSIDYVIHQRNLIEN